MAKRTKSDSMKKDQSGKLESSAASPKRAKSSTGMATEMTKTASRKRKLVNSNTVLRRSQRIQNVISCTTEGKDIESVIEKIDLTGNDEDDHRDEERHHSYEDKRTQEEDSGIHRNVILGTQGKDIKTQEEYSGNRRNAISCTQGKDIKMQEEDSGIYRNAILFTQGKDIDPVYENIDLSGSVEEDHQDEERHRSYEERNMQVEDLGIHNMEGKIDYLTLLLETEEKFHEAKSMGPVSCFHSQNMCCADIKAQMKKDKYKLMYKDSQKKVDRLQEENRQLAMNLGNALGKLEAYEKGHTVFSETIEKLKDAMLISTLTKTAEMMFGFSSARVNNGECAAPPTVAETPVSKKERTAKSSGRK